MANVVSWFEIPASNFERAVDFYSSILDIALEESDALGFPMAFFPNEGEGTTGAIIYTRDYVPTKEGTIVYLNATGKINTILAKIEEEGGYIEMPKTSIGENFGHVAVFLDSEGNRVGLHSDE